MPANRLKLVEKELNFETVGVCDVPHERKGKHNALMTRILHDLQRIQPGIALKIPVSVLGSDKIENIRAALAREIKKTTLKIGTSIDDDYFYVWRKKS
jgi:hypothetical protein